MQQSGLRWAAGVMAFLALALALGAFGPTGVPDWMPALGAGAVALGLGVAAQWPRREAQTAQEGRDPTAAAASPDIEVEEALRRLETSPRVDAPRPPAPTSDPGEPFDLYISYASSDRQPPYGEPYWIEAFLRRLNEARRQVGRVGDYNVYFDTAEERVSLDLDPRGAPALQASTALLVLLTPRWLASARCHDEWRAFVDRMPAGASVGVLPVLLEPFELTPQSSPTEIAGWLESLPEDLPRPPGDPRSVATDIHQRVRSVSEQRPLDLALGWDCAWHELMSNRTIEETLRAFARRIDETLDAAQRTLRVPHDPFFVGREHELELMRSAFPSRIAVVSGADGAGRAALVAHHALERAHDYSGGAHWLSGHGHDSLDGVLLEWAKRLGFSEAGATLVEALREGCGPRGACLVVLHDAPSTWLRSTVMNELLDASWIHVAALVEALEETLPRSTEVPVGPISGADGAEVIRRRLPGRAFADDEQRRAAEAIVVELHGHAASVQAASVELGLTPPHRCTALLARLERGEEDAASLRNRHASRLPSTPARSQTMKRESETDQH